MPGILDGKLRKRHEVHEAFLRLYRHADAYADLLQAAGNYDKAEQVRADCRTVAKNHMLDDVLKGNV